MSDEPWRENHVKQQLQTKSCKEPSGVARVCVISFMVRDYLCK